MDGSQCENMEPLFLADCHGGTEWHEGLGETCLTGVQPNNPQLLRSWTHLSVAPLLQRVGCIGAL